MDRAHRLGQLRPVSVYRLIALGTLEDRIMGLQRFKERVAEATVGSESSHTSSDEINTDNSVMELLLGAAERKDDKRGLTRKNSRTRGFVKVGVGKEPDVDSESDCADEDMRVAEAESLDLQSFITSLRRTSSGLNDV